MDASETSQTGPVLKVFQAEPLAYEDWTGQATRIPLLLDLEIECTTLKEAINGTGINLVFEIATANNLGNCLSQGNRFLHFSCHGHQKYLFIENDHGGGQMLLVNENLKEWIRAGGNKLEFVFVSACHSRSAGEAFVAAGVKHVVCCGRNDQGLSDVATIVFARDFYRALANGRTIQQAYDLAIHAVIHAPEMIRTGLTPEVEAKKFALLPEDATHDVPLFFDQEHPQELIVSAPVVSMLPVPPQDFLGRELDMFRVMKALFVNKSRLVRITGLDGMGKTSLAKAVGHYMERRSMWGDMFWLPSTRKKDNDISSHLSQLFELLENKEPPKNLLLDKTYRMVIQRILDQLYEKKAVIIINTVGMIDKSVQKIGIFLDDLFEHTKNVKVILIHRKNKAIESKKTTGFPCTKTEISIGPLDFESTVALFGRVSEYVAPNDWVPLNNLLAKRTKSVTKVLGEGIPTKTILVAKNMTLSEYKKLVESGTPIMESDFEDSLRMSESLGQSKPLPVEDEEESPRPPLRSQDEVQTRFVPLLKKEGIVCRKNVTSFIRKGVKGEKIVTAIDGVQESENEVKDDNSWVVCGRAAGEYYVLSGKDFEDCYDESSAKPIIQVKGDPTTQRLHQQGFLDYRSKRQVWARKVDEHDMKYFRHGEKDARTAEAYFVAPWGESMRVEQGDYLVMQYPGGNDEIYRVERAVFGFSYIDSSRSELPEMVADVEGSLEVELPSFDLEVEAPRPPLRLQVEVQTRFVPLLKKEGQVCRKNVTSFIRRGVKGEEIVTTIDGVHESNNTVKDDNSWVVCGRAAGEYYVLSGENFEDCYDEGTAKPIIQKKSNPMTKRLHQQGFLDYRSKRQVWARKVDEHDMKYFRHGEEGTADAYFMAPWGEKMRVEHGDYLVMEYPGGNDEIYRVECAVFGDSYKKDSCDGGRFWKKVLSRFLK